VIEGRKDVGLIVFTPPPGMLKVIVSRPGLAFASVMAWRSDPGPLSLVFVTVKVAARAESGAMMVGNRTVQMSRTIAAMAILRCQRGAARTA
jgi:hypothetical protein